MAFAIEEFRSKMAYDGARPNLFKITLQFPNLLAAASRPSQDVSFMAHAASLPGSTVGVARQNYFGREVKFPGNRVFQDWNITIINDESFNVRDSFEAWSNLINSHKANVRNRSAVRASGGYAVDAYVTQYGKDGDSKGIKEYKFIGLFPTQIDPIQLDWGNNDRIEEFGVTFAYQYWESNTTS